MSRKKFAGWAEVARLLNQTSLEQQSIERADVDGKGPKSRLNEGQRKSLEVIAHNIVDNGIVLADEVGMGKTRIAAELARCVIAAGGRVVIVLPPGLSFQWKEELRTAGVEVPPVIRSLDGYFAAWDEKKPDKEKPAPWFDQSAVMVSQMFTSHWRLGMAGGRRPWALFSELFVHWRTLNNGRRPGGYAQHSALNSKLVSAAAASSIFAAIQKQKHRRLRVHADEMFEGVSWSQAQTADSYEAGGPLRPGIQKAVGLGLGAFDLVIIDEAHKNRREGGGLSVLLDNVLVRSIDARVFGMTATPVELEMSQWIQTLKRVGVDEARLKDIAHVIKDYGEKLQRVRGVWQSSKEARDAFKRSADDFFKALSPYLIRRDKREDASVMRFKSLSGLHFNEYRDVRREVVLDPAKLSSAWRQAICGAESISVSSPEAGSASARRLRLTVANGHGISSLIAAAAALKAGTADDAMDQEEDTERDRDEPQAVKAADSPGSEWVAKRTARFQWWIELIAQAVPADGHALYDHPAILAAVRDLESANEAGEKVLVFGRFTAPLAALVGLLNARELLRRVVAEQHWPQAKVHETDVAAVGAARRQWAEEKGSAHPVAEADLDALLKRRYDVQQTGLERLRSGLLNVLAAGLPHVATDPAVIARNQALLDAFVASAKAHPSVLALVHRALVETLGDVEAAADARQVTQVFLDLVDAAQDQDRENDDGKNITQDEQAALWSVVQDRIKEEYDRPEGGFARLMYGDTKPSTRRFLQQAFNRPNSFPKILVAQSMVGREGLNLHKACRIVMMLQPEWNPGVVEQQIGRVDRVGSHWAQQLEAAAGINASEWPRIEVRPVIFKGTYDEHHWDVLRQRWDDLRAQLHGVILPPGLAGEVHSVADKACYDEVMAMAPNFSPMLRNLL
jgi:superfamily II DNA or RNA helicase